MSAIHTFLKDLGPYEPWALLGLFLGASFLIIWRLEHMTSCGLEGTVLGTLVMPYCSGLGNLIFVFIAGRTSAGATEIVTNCLVNNVTNMTLVIGVPALLWGLSIIPAPAGAGKKGRKGKGGRRPDTVPRLNRLSLLLTLLAVAFFTGAFWALGRDGRLGFTDGLVLCGVFLFWQSFHVFDVLKENVNQSRSLPWMLVVDFALLLVAGFATYISIDGLVTWLTQAEAGFLSAKNLGWLSGWLMVLPNAMLAMYYGWRGRAEVIYSSQVGDCHICVPLCLGLAALGGDVVLPRFWQSGVWMLFGAVTAHFLLIGLFGRVPRWLGWAFVVAYAAFLKLGLWA